MGGFNATTQSATLSFSNTLTESLLLRINFDHDISWKLIPECASDTVLFFCCPLAFKYCHFLYLSIVWDYPVRLFLLI